MNSKICHEAIEQNQSDDELLFFDSNVADTAILNTEHVEFPTRSTLINTTEPLPLGTDAYENLIRNLSNDRPF